MEPGLAAVVCKQLSQKLRKKLETLQISDRGRRLRPVCDNQVAIPVLNREPLESYKNGEFYQIEGIQFCLENISLPQSKSTGVHSPYKRLHDSLKELMVAKNICWTSELAGDIPHKWEQHGDMVLLPSGCFSRQEWQCVAAEVYRTTCEVLDVKRLAIKCAISCDKYRSPQVTLLIGDNGWVKHVDNGIIYTYDVTRCMFSAGNITEKLRIASFDCSGETVVDMFAGIGYFTLPYLVHAHASKVYACEWNPYAVEALKLNLVLNRVDMRCEVLEGDNRMVCPKGVADHVNLGLIPSSESSWPAACMALKPAGGILHIHGNVTDMKKPGAALGHVKPTENTDCRKDKQCEYHHAADCVSSDDVSVSDPACLSTPSEHIVISTSSVRQNQSSPSTEIGQLSDIVQQCHREQHIRRFEKKVKQNSAWLVWANGVCSKIEGLLSQLHNEHWFCKVKHIEHVKSYAPHIDHLVVDLECRPSDK